MAELKQLTDEERAAFRTAMLPPAVREQINRIANEVAKFLRRHRAKFWACGETVRGAHVFGGVTPWDPRVGFGVLAAGFDAAAGNTRELELAGLAVRKSEGFMHVYSPVLPLPVPADSMHTHVGCDIFLFAKGAAVEPAVPALRAFLPGDSWKKTDLLATVDVPFGAGTVPVAHKPKKQLRAAFGDDWDRAARVPTAGPVLALPVPQILAELEGADLVHDIVAQVRDATAPMIDPDAAGATAQLSSLAEKIKAQLDEFAAED